ncbi:acyl carrier protein [Microvenator marinus]|jgi:acyl carrier protein|uniref:Acyl carrier protein n=1 Tax=Microvenator marinus TaxID=2600177 RepID=A0A5B8XWV3_9DELT|nr:acyl carrier protein [Microvenator marinus]QED30085.1 acyl carrier protein [Microvenator marinus]
MNDNEVIALIKEALDEVAPGKSAEVTLANMDMKIRDLAIDSVVTMEMVGVIEERLNTTFPDEDLAQVSKLSDLAKLIRSAS